MKKLRLSNIFHWLYAILMFLPFLLYLFNVLVNFGTGNNVDFFDLVVSEFNIVNDGISSVIGDVFVFFSFDVLGLDNGYSVYQVVFQILPIYWVCVSAMWLCFDLVMFMINLAHRWIDKGGIE